MVRTQIYLTENEKTALGALGNATGKAQSKLIREAIDDLIARFSKDRRMAVLNKTAGLWKARKDLPDFRSVRKGWDR